MFKRRKEGRECVVDVLTLPLVFLLVFGLYSRFQFYHSQYAESWL